MFFTVALLCIRWYQSIKERYRMNRFVNIIESAGRLGSLVIRRATETRATSLSSADTPAIPSYVTENQDGWRNTPFFLEKGVEMSTVSPQLTVELVREWISFLHNQSYPDQPVATDPDKVYILLEACHTDDEEDFLARSFSSNSKRFKLTNYANPIAWRSGEPFGVVAECTLTNLAKLTMAFVDGMVTLDDMLDLHSLSTVQLKGRAANLLRVSSSDDSVQPVNSCASPLSPLSEKQNQPSEITSGIPYLPKDLIKEEDGYCGSNESLAYAGSTDGLIGYGSRMPPGSSTCSNFGDSELDIDLEDGTAGEAMSASVIELAPELVTPAKRSHDNQLKPPNVLVYCGDEKDMAVKQFANISQVLQQSLNADRYVIYHLKHEQVVSTPWQENCVLLIIATEHGKLDSFLDFYTRGGTVLSFGSSFNSFFMKKSVSEPSSEELVSVDYKDWKGVHVLGRAVKYSEQEISLSDTVTSSVAVESGSGATVCIEATNDITNGVALLSQVCLEKDPSERGDIPSDFSRLKQSNAARFGILGDWLERLGIDCTTKPRVDLTPYWLLTTDQSKKSDLINAISVKFNNDLVICGKIKLKFSESYISNDTDDDVTPIITTADPQQYQFNLQTYSQALTTKHLGKVVLYSDVVTSTMDVINSLMMHAPGDAGLVAIASRQTSGQGRGGNAWLSPLGCAMFSLHIHMKLGSKLGQTVAFVQHITALAVVQAVRATPGYEDINIRLKWPNDIYFGSTMKLGGVIVKSTILRDTIHCNIGCGFNVSNKNPTICINDLIEQYNAEHEAKLALFSTEELLARTFSHIEKLIDCFQNEGRKAFEELYYLRWLHSDAQVEIQDVEGNRSEVTVVGLDEFGYLAVRNANGDIINVHPDGNSFDMMRNLIAPKSR